MSAEIVNRAQSRLGMVLNGKWRLDEILGVGGMATVYAATHRNQKRVAVKMLHTELSTEDSVRTRFLREGYLANTVDHPGAVTVFDDDIAEDGSAFLVMELLEGETIHSRVMRDGPLPELQALRMSDDVLDVLIAAHGKRIIHRDLKPENLFITRDGHVKVLDFGIARLREFPFAGPSATASGFFMGTPAFMAPEHARGKWSEVDVPSDLWSVGATLFTMLTGKFVHDSETAMDTLVMAVTRKAPSIRSVKPDLDPGVAEVIDRALAFDKQDRWASAHDMQRALRAASADLLAGAPPVSRASDRPPTTPTFASPPYSPLRVYQATVRSARPPAPVHLSTDAPLTSSLMPDKNATDPHALRSSVSSNAGAAESRGKRRQLGRLLVIGVSLALFALPALWLLSRTSASRSSLDEAQAGAEVPARREAPRETETPRTGAGRSAAAQAREELHPAAAPLSEPTPIVGEALVPTLVASAAAPSASAAMIARPPRPLARPSAEVRNVRQMHGLPMGPPPASGVWPASSAPAEGALPEPSPFDRRF